MMAVTSDIGPRGPLLFFDGECALCHGAVRRILKWERPQEQGIMFAPLHGETAERLRQAGDLPEDKEAVILWTAEGTTQGEAAVGHVLDIIGRKGWARAFSCMPYALRTMGYRLTARNRHRWFGRVPASCPMPSQPSRFLP